MVIIIVIIVVVIIIGFIIITLNIIISDHIKLSLFLLILNCK